MKLWLVISFLLVFGAGGALGFLAGSRVAIHPAEVAVSYFDAYSEVPLFLLTRSDVYKQLGLDGRQRGEVESLLERYYEQVRSVRSGMEEVVSDLQMGIDDLLTDEQRSRFGKIKEDYAKDSMQLFVRRELATLRPELKLHHEQIGPVYQVLYDSALERRTCVEGLDWKRDRDKVREKFEQTRARRDVRMKEILTSEQFDKYRELKERERRWRGKHRKHRRNGKKDDEASSPST